MSNATTEIDRHPKYKAAYLRLVSGNQVCLEDRQSIVSLLFALEHKQDYFSTPNGISIFIANIETIEWEPQP